MYKLEDKNYQFGRVSLKDALLLKDAFFIIAQDMKQKEEGLKITTSPDQLEKANNLINDLTIKYLEIEEDGQFNRTNIDYLELFFENPFAILEIVATFQEHISGFINRLPKFQQKQETAKVKRK